MKEETKKTEEKYIKQWNKCIRNYLKKTVRICGMRQLTQVISTMGKIIQSKDNKMSYIKEMTIKLMDFQIKYMGTIIKLKVSSFILRK